MDAPSLEAFAPTDNLYKWVAFIGLSLMPVGFYIGDYGKDVIRAKSEAYQNRLIELQQELAAAEYDLKNPIPNSTEAERNARQIQAGRDMARINAGLELLSEQSTYFAKAKEELELSESVGVGLFVLGLAITPVGIALWYVMFQRHQDVLLKLQRSRAEKESADALVKK